METDGGYADSYAGDYDSTDDPGPGPQAGGAFINSGTYGCAFSPPLKCKKNTFHAYPRDNDTFVSKVIGKVFSDANAFSAELAEIERIDRFDPSHIFTVPFLGNCKTHKNSFKPSDETPKCHRHLTPTRAIYNQLMYEYGGYDLATLYEKPANQSIVIDDLVRAYLPILEGILRMQTAGYAHADIKPPNMLIDPTATQQTLKLYLIDFGLLTPLKDLKIQFFLHEHHYPYYPPEFRIFNSVRRGIYEHRSILQMCLDNFSFFHTGTFMQWINKRWPRYLLELDTAVLFLIKMPFHQLVLDFDDEYAKKVDLYGLGMSIVEIIFRLETTFPNHLHVSSSAFLDRLLTEVLFPMIHPNVFYRITVQDAIDRIKKIFPSLSMAKAQAHAPPRAHPIKPKKPVKSHAIKDGHTALPNKPNVPSPASPASPTRPVSISKQECAKLKVSQIREMLEKHQLPKYGTKQVMCERLVEVLQHKSKEHNSAKKILKEAVKKDKKNRKQGSKEPLPTPPPVNSTQRAIDRIYTKPLTDCNNSDEKGGYPITELRGIAKDLKLTHQGKRKEICNELLRLRKQ